MTKPARLRRVLIPLVIIALGAVGGTYYYRQQAADNNSELRLYGNVDLREAELAFMVQGRLAQLLVEEGDTVQQGQLLAELDTERFAQNLARLKAETEAQRQMLAELVEGSRPQEIKRAAAEVAAAEAGAEDARNTFKRVTDLVKKQLATEQQADDAHAAWHSAEAQLNAAKETLALLQEGSRRETIAAARARLEAAQAAQALAAKDLADTRLYAPTAGVIRTRILEPGEIASPQKPVYTLAQTRPVWVRAYVTGAQLGRIHPGQAVMVHTSSYPGHAYAGTVGYISPSAEFTPKAVQTEEVRASLVYQVRITVPEPRDQLRLGMPVTVVVAEGGAP
jgi:HlyD family secretion protein